MQQVLFYLLNYYAEVRFWESKQFTESFIYFSAPQWRLASILRHCVCSQRGQKLFRLLDWCFWGRKCSQWFVCFSSFRCVSTVEELRQNGGIWEYVMKWKKKGNVFSFFNFFLTGPNVFLNLGVVCCITCKAVSA